MRHGRITFFGGELPLRFAELEPGPPATRASLFEALARHDPAVTHRITFSGGSPTGHPDFFDVARECRARGFADLTLETDGAPLSDPDVVEALAASGFQTLRIVCPAIREPIHDRMMRTSGTFKQSIVGLGNALASDLRVYVVVPLARPNQADIEPLTDWLMDQPKRPRGLLVDVPFPGSVHPHLHATLLRPADAARTAGRVFSTCHDRRVEYGFASKRAISACAVAGILDRFGAVFHERFTFMRSRDEPLARVDACATCSLNASCKGIEPAHLAAFGAAELQPIPLEVSTAWKLRKLNRLDEFDYKNVSPFEAAGGRSARGLLRVNGHCNMSCAFCFVDRTVPDFATDELRKVIDGFADGGTRHLVLSGGEPTLHPDLDALIAHGRARSFDTIEIQTNGVRAADLEYAQKLVDAGLTKVSVSLHSVDPERSDRITKLPQAFGKTVRALHNFRKLGVQTQIAHVITKNNFRELPDTFRFFAKEFPADGGRLSVCLAIAQGMSDLVYMWVVPSFTEIKPYVKEALDIALEANVGFGGMIGQGGYPPCMLDGELEYYEKVLDQIFLSDDFDDQFYKPARCAECSFTSRCIGVRKSYVEAYGDEEIRPFHADVTGLPPLRALTDRATTRLVQLRGRVKSTATP